MRTTTDPHWQTDWLSPAELAAFNQWFKEFDAAARERQLAANKKAVDLDMLTARHVETNGASTRALP